MHKKYMQGFSKALILSMVLTTALPGAAFGNGTRAERRTAGAETRTTEAEAKTAGAERVSEEIKTKTAGIEALLKEKGPYDVLIRLIYTGEDQSLSRKEKAQASQKELIALLEKGSADGNVTEYKTFYIVNSAHAVITDAELIREIAKLPNVEKITPNGHVDLIEPIKDEAGTGNGAESGTKDGKEGSEAEGDETGDAETEQKEEAVQPLPRMRARSIYEPDERNIEWGVDMVHADEVWEDFAIDGSGVTVGIIDTGVNYRLPAIKHAYKGYDAASDTFDTQYYFDAIDNLEEPEAGSVNDHGTHVAGSIAGREGENLNQIGVAPGAKYISARALNDEGGQTDDLLEAAEWMLEQDPDVINNSWGGTNDNDEWFNAIVDAWIEAGIVPVFAAGNWISGEPLPGPGSITNPGNLLNVLSVGAVDRNKKLGDFSKRGPSAFDDSGAIIKPELSAPGVQVRSVNAEGQYVSWNGTSMAAPHVTGVVALLRQAKPDISVEEIKNLLTETAEPLTDMEYPESPNMGYGYGLVNAYDAVARLEGRETGSITGTVLRKGRDSGAAQAEFQLSDTVYIGRDVDVFVNVKEDVSVRSAKLFYTLPGESTEQEAELQLSKGVQNDGTYTAAIPADMLSAGELALRAEITDYAYNVTKLEKQLPVKAGVLPGWKEDFEKPLQGFLMEGL